MLWAAELEPVQKGKISNWERNQLPLPNAPLLQALNGRNEVAEI